MWFASCTVRLTTILLRHINNMTNVVPEYLRSVNYAEQLRIRSLSLTDPVNELRYIGPYFASILQGVGVFTLRQLVKYLDVDDTNTVYNRLSRALQNDRRNQIVRRAGSPGMRYMTGDVNRRAFNSVIHFLHACASIKPRSPLRDLTYENIPLFFPVLSFSGAHCRAHDEVECGGVKRYCKWSGGGDIHRGVCTPRSHNARSHEEVGADDASSVQHNVRYTAARLSQSQTVDHTKVPVRSGEYLGGWRSPGYLPRRRLVRQSHNP